MINNEASLSSQDEPSTALSFLFILFDFFSAARYVGSQFPDQGSDPCPLQRKHRVSPLDRQGSPCLVFPSTTFSSPHKCPRFLNSILYRKQLMLKKVRVQSQDQNPREPESGPKPSPLCCLNRTSFISLRCQSCNRNLSQSQKLRTA